MQAGPASLWSGMQTARCPPFDCACRYSDRHANVRVAPVIAGPDAYWYNSTRTPGLLRFEDAPRPGHTLQLKRIAGKHLALPLPVHVRESSACAAGLHYAATA